MMFDDRRYKLDLIAANDANINSIGLYVVMEGRELRKYTNFIETTAEMQLNI